MTTKEFLLLLLFFLFLLWIVYKYTNLFQKKDKYDKISPCEDTYEGICLFDIDGTLTTGKDNYNVVQTCLDKGYAVGISTAGSMYQPDNINSAQFASWMPTNLYNFMKKRNFDTFNNVASNMLCGKDAKAEYTNLFVPNDIWIWGIRKALALEKTAKNLGITNPCRMIMFDNDNNYLDGMRYVNPNFTLVCSGDPCGGQLDVDTVNYALSSWNGN